LDAPFSSVFTRTLRVFTPACYFFFLAFFFVAVLAAFFLAFFFLATVCPPNIVLSAVAALDTALGTASSSGACRGTKPTRLVE
jgi:hypothetical protein